MITTDPLEALLNNIINHRDHCSHYHDMHPLDPQIDYSMEV